jgi:hypothetical protein
MRSKDRYQEYREYTSIFSLDYCFMVSTDEVSVKCYSRKGTAVSGTTSTQDWQRW